MERRLVTILAADAVGYSRLVADDEDAALTLFQRCGAIMTEIFQAHQGRVFGGAGDSVVCEFSSPVEALRCAVEIQQQLEKADEKLDEEKRMRFRLGLNLGDAVVVDGNLFGEAVNVAARLEGLAEPGGICISGGLYEQVKHLPDFGFRDLGMRNLKNIPFQVKVYAVEGTNERRSVKRVIPRWWPAAAAILVLVVVLGGWKYLSSIPSITASSQPSIAVLPLDNLSGDASQQYFSDGLTQDITTDLSKFSNLFVVASNSAFTYKGKPTKAQDIGRDLGARYLLEGTVQRSNGTIRINTQLIDANSGNHIWAERYEGKVLDLFAFQDMIIRDVVIELDLTVNDAELSRIVARETKSLDAYEFGLKGRAIFTDPQKQNKEGNDEARKYFQEAIRLDPNYSFAYAELSYVYVQDWQNDWSDNAGDALNEALKYAKKAVELNGNQAVNHWTLAIVYSNLGKFDEAMDEYAIAKTLNPNDANILAEMGDALVQQGRSLEAIEQIEQAIDRNRKDTPYWYYWSLARAQYMVKRYDDAIASVQKIKDPPYDLNLVLAVCYARKGMIKEAQAEVQKFLKFEPNWTVKDSARYHWKNPEDKKHWLEGLELAGLPKG